MAPHMRLQRIPTGMIAGLTLALAPFANILGLLRPAGCTMRALHMLHQLIIVNGVAVIAVSPETLRLRFLAEGVFVM